MSTAAGGSGSGPRRFHFVGTLGPSVCTAENRVLDATGAAQHHTLRSRVPASLTHPSPVATDDHGETTSGTPVTLAGEVYDFESSSSLNPYETFPATR